MAKHVAEHVGGEAEHVAADQRSQEALRYVAAEQEREEGRQNRTGEDEQVVRDERPEQQRHRRRHKRRARRGRHAAQIEPLRREQGIAEERVDPV